MKSRQLIWFNIQTLVFWLAICLTSFAQEAVFSEQTQSGYNPHAVFEKGTLIVMVPTAEGILVCADKRIYSKSQGARDNMDKIVKIGPSSGITIVGGPIVSDSITGKILYNAFDILKDYFNDRNIIDSDSTWNEIQKVLVQRFRETVLSRQYKGWPETQNQSEEISLLYTVIFFHLGLNSQPKTSLLKFKYEKQIEPIVNTEIYNLTTKGSFAAFGSGHVIRELQFGNDSRFDDMRHDTRLMMFLSNSVSATDAKLEDAIYFGRTIISESSNRYPLVTSIDGHISPISDCAVLKRKDGFRFIEK